MDDKELNSSILLNVAVPANEGRLRNLLWQYSPVEALHLIQCHEASERWLKMAIERARARLESFNLADAVSGVEKLALQTIPAESISGISHLGGLAPWVIFATAEFQNTSYAAVVGTRECSKEGIGIARDITANLIGEERLISGGANGIDVEAHQQAKDSGIHQLMVLAGGLDSVFPKKAADLITTNFPGVAISEMPPGVRSGKIGYLNRNRLIAAICEKLFLVEAPVVSGSIHTAQHALRLGREVIVCLTDDENYSPGGRWLGKKPGVRSKVFSRDPT